MIDSQRLLQETKKLLASLERDIRERLDESPEQDAQLQAEWNAARSAKRTAGAYLDWRDENITQSAVHWILACVFLRFLEDNNFLARVYLTSADSEARASGRDNYERYFGANPNHSDLDYLLHAFREVARLPALKGLYDEQHNPLFRLQLSGDGGMALLAFWRKVNPESGALVHDFTDPTRGTRFLGDLYQDLSESARERFALLQTPEFVEEFILDRTLTPAIDTFGYRDVRLIDPTCGSGHFLLGAFQRLFDLWAKRQPARNLPDIAQQALNGVYGVDLNPFAVEIARFRLLIAALAASDIHMLKDAPDFRVHLAAGDSLLHGPRFGLRGTAGMFESKEDFAETGLAHAYQMEDLSELQRILGQQYHAVVGNPPYITPKDGALRAEYRTRYISCHMKYSLGAPFTERFFELAAPAGGSASAGFVGMITTNSFMKREFGKKLIETFLPSVDLTHVIDTSGAYIPGHGTPTVVLLGRHRHPVGDVIRIVMGIKGEPTTPADPAHGQVWSAIVAQLDQVGSESEFVSVADTARATFSKHPWSIGGGGAAELKEIIEGAATHRLQDEIAIRRSVTLIGDREVVRETLEIGFASFPGQDEVFLRPRRSLLRRHVPEQFVRDVITGDVVRDWLAFSNEAALAPYDEKGALVQLDTESAWGKDLWSFRSVLNNTMSFGGNTKEDLGQAWWGWYRWIKERYASLLTITFAEVASHNNFVLDRGGKVFKQTAPIIKLKDGAGEAEYLALLGLLNSSVTCFYLKQVSHQKQMMGGDGIRISEKSKVPYQFASTRVQELPLPSEWHTHPLKPRLTELAGLADELARTVAEPNAADVIKRALASGESMLAMWKDVVASRAAARSRQIIVQEEIDFVCYAMHDLTDDSALLAETIEWDISIDAGARPFCINSQRNVDGFDVPSEVPAHWPESMRRLWERRMKTIKEKPPLRVIEDPHYKRRWVGRQGLFNHTARVDEFSDALKEWLLDRLETERYWPLSGTPQLRSVFQLSDVVRSDPDFMRVAAISTGRDDFDVGAMVAELVESEAVPYLSAWRYTDDGLRKREAWEETWALQRREDVVDQRVAAANPRSPEDSDEDYRKRLAPLQREARLKEVGEVPVPPKYKPSDVKGTRLWRLRGAFDVPKERFISYPAATADADGTMLLGWAGWDHLQQAIALAGHYLHLKDNEGWQPDRLIPLLAGLHELVHWLKQWHNEWNAEHDARMGDYFDGFVLDEVRALGGSVEALKKWRPPVTARRKRKA